MIIDPDDIQLTDGQRRLLAAHAERTGRPWDEVLKDALKKIRVNTDCKAKGIIGLFSNEPELIDEIVESGFRSRESTHLREAGDT